MHGLCCGQIGLQASLRLQGFKSNARFEGCEIFCEQLRQAFQRGLYILVLVAFDDFTFWVDNLGSKQTGAMQIEPRIEGLLIEGIDEDRILLGDVIAAHVLAHHAGVLALGQSVVVAVPRAGFGLFDAQFFQDFCHSRIDVFRAII